MSTEPGTRAALFATAACAFGLIFDLSEIFFGNALSGVFSAAPYSVPARQLSWLLSSVYAGAILGPPLFGWLADLRGRRIALTVTMLLMCVTSLASAASPGIGVLTALRGLGGVALGAYPPLMFTYLADTLPARLRGRMIMLTVALAYLGPPATIFLLRWLTAHAPFGFEGWRWMIGLDGVGALLSAALCWRLPESGSWRVAVARGKGREGPPASRLALMAGLSFLGPWSGVAFQMLSAAFLVAKGYNLSDTLLYVGVSTFGPVIGSVLLAPVADRFERRTLLLAWAGIMVAAGVGFYNSDQAIWLMVTSFAFNLGGALYTPTLNTHIAELFAPQARARATSWAWSVNRVGAALVPLVMLPWLRSDQGGLVFAIIVAALAGTALVVALGPRGEAGRAVN